MDEQLLTVTDVAERFAVNPKTIGRWVEAGEFPAPVRINQKTLRWRVSDLLNFIDKRPTARNAAH